MPAHNEAAGISEALAAVKHQLHPGDRLLVVADNCSDNTSDVAILSGAEVVERTEVERIGKGYALSRGLHHLASDPPEVVIIVDADCVVESGAIDKLVSLCISSGRPVQALYRMYCHRDAGHSARIAEFGWVVKNYVRPLGFLRLGMPCQLMGTGMAFPWRVLASADLANNNLVEDMKLGIDLAVAGYPATFCPSALVTSTFPSHKNAALIQRTRWEHGHLSLIMQEFPRLIARSIVIRRSEAFGLALDLAVPPLALLGILVTSTFALSATAACFGMTWVPLALSMIALAMLAIAILLAWQGWGRAILTLSDLLSLPVYAIMKIPLYARFWTARQKNWIRTERDLQDRG